MNVCVQLRLTLCDLMNYSPPGSSVHGILQARILEWGAISFFRGSSRPRDQTQVSCVGRQIVYHRATWEVVGVWLVFVTLLFDWWSRRPLHLPS